MGLSVQFFQDGPFEPLSQAITRHYRRDSRQVVYVSLNPDGLSCPLECVLHVVLPVLVNFVLHRLHDGSASATGALPPSLVSANPSMQRRNTQAG